MGSARETAVLTLAACERQGAWSDVHLKRSIREQGLDRRDAALCARLCYGVLQNKLLLDWRLAQVCSMKLPSSRSCPVRTPAAGGAPGAPPGNAPRTDRKSVV